MTNFRDWLHFTGTNNLIGWLLLAFVRRSPRLILVAIASSYMFAWVGHLLIQRNRPATWEYQVLSALCEIQMYLKIWDGSMDAEVAQFTSGFSRIVS